MIITTKTGDRGTTALYDGTRVPKDDARIELNGQLDELNSLLGLCKVGMGAEEPFATVQRELMILMAMIAGCNERSVMTAKQLEVEETRIRQLTCAVEAMEEVIQAAAREGKFEFVLPGKDFADAALHIARAKARTCERRFVTLNRLEQTVENTDDSATSSPYPSVIGVYLNRLSDFLFALSLD